MFDILLFDVLFLELDTRTRHSNSSFEVEYRTRPLRSSISSKFHLLEVPSYRSSIYSKFHPLEVPSSRSYILSKFHPLEVPSTRSSILSKFNPLEVTSHRISISSNFEYRTSNIELRASNCCHKRDTPGLTHSTKLVSSFMTILLGYF